MDEKTASDFTTLDLSPVAEDDATSRRTATCNLGHIPF